MEIYKDISGYEGLYQASNLGNIKSLGNTKTRKDKILKAYYKEGYARVQLFTYGGKQNLYVHRLVMMAFNGKSDLEVNHINHNPSDNRLENLEYVTKLDNIKKRRLYRVICCPHCNSKFEYRKSPTP